jgi:hypothetical protein
VAGETVTSAVIWKFRRQPGRERALDNGSFSRREGWLALRILFVLRGEPPIRLNDLLRAPSNDPTSLPKSTR